MQDLVAGTYGDDDIEISGCDGEPIEVRYAHDMGDVADLTYGTSAYDGVARIAVESVSWWLRHAARGHRLCNVRGFAVRRVARDRPGAVRDGRIGSADDDHAAGGRGFARVNGRVAIMKTTVDLAA